MKATEISSVPWKLFIITAIESLMAFYIATFCVAMYFIHRGDNWILLGILLGALYIFVIFTCAKRVLEKMPMAAVFLIVPIAPLIALIIVVSLIPVLQYLQ